MSDTNGSNSGAVLKSYAERASRLMDEREKHLDEAKLVTAEITDVMKEAKSAGFDTKALRKAIGLQRLSDEDRETLGLYVEGLGIFG